jgi:hypothetical protein
MMKKIKYGINDEKIINQELCQTMQSLAAKAAVSIACYGCLRGKTGWILVWLKSEKSC